MSKIAEAYVELSARMEKMDADLKAAKEKFEKATEKMQKDADKLGGGMTSLYDKAMKVKLAYFAVAGAIGGVGAVIVGAVKQTADYLDQIDEMSTKTGVSVEMLTSLNLAAKKNGVTLDSLATSIRMMYRSLYDANEGVKESADIYKRLGVEVKDASGKLKSGNDAFIEVADAIAKIENPAERSAAAMKVFGRAGTEMLPMLEGGKEALRGYIDEAMRLGLVFTEADAKAAAAFNDQLDAFNAQISALKMKLTVPFIASLSAFISTLRGEAIAGPVVEYAAGKEIDKLVNNISKAQEKIMGLEQDIADGVLNAPSLPAIIEEETKKIEGWLQRYELLTSSLDIMKQKNIQPPPPATIPKPTLTTADDKKETIVAFLESAGREDAVAWYQNIGKVIEDDREATEDWIKSFGDLTEGIEETGEVMQNKLLEPFAAMTRDMQWQWQSTIADFIKGGSSFGEFMANMFEGVLSSFANMVAEMAAQWLTQSLFGSVLGVAGGNTIPGIQVPGGLQARAGTGIVINAIDTQSFHDALTRNAASVTNIVHESQLYGRAS